MVERAGSGVGFPYIWGFNFSLLLKENLDLLSNLLRYEAKRGAKEVGLKNYHYT